MQNIIKKILKEKDIDNLAPETRKIFSAAR